MPSWILMKNIKKSLNISLNTEEYSCYFAWKIEYKLQLQINNYRNDISFLSEKKKKFLICISPYSQFCKIEKSMEYLLKIKITLNGHILLQFGIPSTQSFQLNGRFQLQLNDHRKLIIFLSFLILSLFLLLTLNGQI